MFNLKRRLSQADEKNLKNTAKQAVQTCSVGGKFAGNVNLRIWVVHGYIRLKNSPTGGTVMIPSQAIKPSQKTIYIYIYKVGRCCNMSGPSPPAPASSRTRQKLTTPLTSMASCGSNVWEGRKCSKHLVCINHIR